MPDGSRRLRIVSEEDATTPARRPALGSANLFQHHHRKVVRWAQLLGGPVIEPEDVLQDVFEIVERKIGGFRGEAHPLTWLYKITENVVRRHRRREWLRKFVGGGANEVATSISGTYSGPLESLEQTELTSAVYRVLDWLRDQHRTVFILFELEGMSGAEIAAFKGVPLATVWTWLRRARAEFTPRMLALERSQSLHAGSKK